MPIYQYECCDCHEEFEYAVFRSDDQPSCPNCASSNLEKQVSVFSVGKSAAGNSSKNKKQTDDVVKELPKKHSHEHVGCSKSYVKSLLKKYA